MFDPIENWHSRRLFSEKSKLPKSYSAFCQYVAVYYQNDEETLMTNCKKHLSYKDLPNGEMDDIALPFLLKVKSYIAKPPSFGYYITKLLQSFTLITLIFRCIDGVTDFTLTGTYFTNWEKVINESFTQGIAKQNKTMNELCVEELRHKVVCIIPTRF